MFQTKYQPMNRRACTTALAVLWIMLEAPALAAAPTPVGSPAPGRSSFSRFATATGNVAALPFKLTARGVRFIGGSAKMRVSEHLRARAELRAIARREEIERRKVEAANAVEKIKAELAAKRRHGLDAMNQRHRNKLSEANRRNEENKLAAAKREARKKQREDEQRQARHARERQLEKRVEENQRKRVQLEELLKNRVASVLSPSKGDPGMATPLTGLVEDSMGLGAKDRSAKRRSPNMEATILNAVSHAQRMHGAPSRQEARHLRLSRVAATRAARAEHAGDTVGAASHMAEAQQYAARAAAMKAARESAAVAHVMKKVDDKLARLNVSANKRVLVHQRRQDLASAAKSKLEQGSTGRSAGLLAFVGAGLAVGSAINMTAMAALFGSAATAWITATAMLVAAPVAAYVVVAHFAKSYTERRLENKANTATRDEHAAAIARNVAEDAERKGREHLSRTGLAGVGDAANRDTPKEAEGKRAMSSMAENGLRAFKSMIRPGIFGKVIPGWKMRWNAKVAALKGRVSEATSPDAVKQIFTAAGVPEERLAAPGTP